VPILPPISAVAATSPISLPSPVTATPATDAGAAERGVDFGKAVVNALENLRSAREFAMTANTIQNRTQFDNLLTVAISQTQDASMVLEEAKLNARQVDQINRVTELLMQAQGNPPMANRVVRGFFFFRRVVDQGVQPNQALIQAIQIIDQASAGLQQQP